MNIKTLINPLIFGREGIDDKLWKIRVSQTTEKGYTAKVYLTNTISIKSAYDGYSAQDVPIKLTFKLTLDGHLEYWQSGLIMRTSGSTQTKAREILKESFSKIRLINNNGID
jgi:hypothetical protein